MALSLVKQTSQRFLFTKLLKTSSTKICNFRSKQLPEVKPTTVLVPKSNLHTSSIILRNNFFVRKTSDELWKASTSVSSQGKARGRAKGLMRFRNLNRGQRIGYGIAKVAWPGLNAPLVNKRTKVETLNEEAYNKYKEEVNRKQTLYQSRKSIRKRQTPLERGWTSASRQGKSFGPPVPTTHAVSYDGFESILIEQKNVSHMTGNFGRVRMNSMLMITGNKKGLAGFALTKTLTGRGPMTIQKAINRAGLKLMYIKLYEDRTVYHDFYTQFGSTRLFIMQRPKGFGIEGHRTIRAACKLIGIKDLEVHLEGARNYNHIIKAFFLGLLRQRTHQALADEKRLHLVELRAENDFFPKVVATPSDGYVRTKEEMDPNEVLDFHVICHEGAVPFMKEPKWTEVLKFKEAWKRTPGYQMYLKRQRTKNHIYDQKVQMLADYGRLESHLTDIYPECVPYYVWEPFVRNKPHWSMKF